MVFNGESFSSLRRKIGWKQDFFGMLFGLSKNALSRIESGRRNETLQQQETINMITFLNENDLLEDYVKWRFDLKITSRFKKKS